MAVSVPPHEHSGLLSYLYPSLGPGDISRYRRGPFPVAPGGPHPLGLRRAIRGPDRGALRAGARPSLEGQKRARGPGGMSSGADAPHPRTGLAGGCGRGLRNPVRPGGLRRERLPPVSSRVGREAFPLPLLATVFSSSPFARGDPLCPARGLEGHRPGAAERLPVPARGDCSARPQPRCSSWGRCSSCSKERSGGFRWGRSSWSAWGRDSGTE